jgi:SAM-dependent methyltransferase
MQISVRTERPVAKDSLDHLEPKGTAQDNSRNRRFNWKLYELYRGLDRPLRILDLGCAGGGFVRDCLYDGRLAVGIEGSDYSAGLGRAEWLLLGGRFLFTADITHPFEVRADDPASGAPLAFDVISLWEVLEHIAEPDLPAVFANIRRHLAPGGLVIASISDEPLPHHRTRQGLAWWSECFQRERLTPVDAFRSYFGAQFVRGPRFGSAASFHVVATNDVGRAPAIPAVRLTSRVLDRFWYGTRVQRQLRQLLGVD